MSLNKLLIMGIQDATSYKPSKKTIIIRILEPRSKNPALYYYKRFVGVLELYFDDLLSKDKNSLPDFIEFFSKKHIQSIQKFLYNYQDAETLVVHCHGGISRSSATALGISWMLNKDEWEQYVLNSPYYLPNPDVLAVWAKELGIINKKQKIIDKYLEPYLSTEIEEFTWD